MRIVTWNCCMAFHRKYERLLDLEPDIAIIPECAEPDVLRQKAPDFAYGDCEWRGTRYPETGVYPHKGLAVFTFGDLRLRLHDSWTAQLFHFLPLEVRGGRTPINLLAVWAYNELVLTKVTANPVTTERAIDRYEAFLRAGPSVVAGDFNGNVRWDGAGCPGRFVDVDASLRRLGLRSAYHELRGEPLGAERQHTFFQRRNGTVSGYHIDYAYVPEAWVPRAQVTLGSREEWLALSDHVPVVIDIPERPPA